MKKKFNKKLLAVGAMVLGLATITGTALATYVITGQVKDATTDVDPSEVLIENRTVALTASVAEGDELLFQPETLVTSGRLQTSEAGSLSITLNVTAETEQQDYIKDISVVVSVKSGNAVSDKYVTLPEETTIKSSSFTGSGGTFTASTELTRSWGTKFGTTDPCTYFNTGEGKDLPLTKAEDTSSTGSVEGEMEKFANSINGTVFLVTLTMA